MSVGTVFDRFGLFVSYEFAETSETMREVRTIVHEKRTLRGEEGLESDGRIVGGVENEMDEEIEGGELGDGIGRIIGEEEITALRSLRDIGKHALHNSEEITTREL